MSVGAHTIKRTSPIVPFGVHAYGFAFFDSYGYPGGLRLAPIALPCTPTATVAGDGIDNDCDGLIDEELNNGIDDDGDSQIDEDLAPNTAPNCSQAGPSVLQLWPPNHKFQSVNVLGVTDPDGDTVSIEITGISQDEPTNTVGDGNSAPDGKGVGTDTAEVKAERSGSKKVPGNGRVYHIEYTASDGAGGSCSGEVRVGVPHDQGKQSVPVDDGALFDSTV